jgi:hypothetical protein
MPAKAGIQKILVVYTEADMDSHFRGNDDQFSNILNPPFRQTRNTFRDETKSPVHLTGILFILQELPVVGSGTAENTPYSLVPA